MDERLGGQPGALLEGEAAGLDGGQHIGVARRRHHHGNARVVLGSRPDHGRAADVDLLDALVDAGPRHHRLRERIQVHHDQVEGLDAECRQLIGVLGLAKVGQDPRVHSRVQRLHPSVEGLREPRQVLDLGHLDAGLRDAGRRRPGRDDLHPGGGQARCELGQPGLVVDADQGTADRTLTHGMVTFLPVTVQPSRASRAIESTSS